MIFMKKQAVLLITVILTVSVASGFGADDYQKLKDLLDIDVDDEGTAALIELDGQISPSSDPGGLSPSTDITPGLVRDLNSEAEERNADAIIYELNSGGGTVVASKEIMREIDSVDTPTVCRIREAGASGAYLAALGCDQIVADPGSMTGSIGVTASYPEFSELMDDYGIDYINITSGERKEVGSPFKNTTEEDREVLTNMTDQIHEEFLGQVTEHRNLTEEQINTVGTGQIFLGEEAHQLGLIDELGGRNTAVEVAENQTGKTLKTETVASEPDFGLLSLFLSSPLNDFMAEMNQETPFQATWR